MIAPTAKQLAVDGVRRGGAVRGKFGSGYLFSVLAAPVPAEILAFQREVYVHRYGVMPEDGRDADSAFLVARTTDESLVASLRVLTSEMRPFSFDQAVDLAGIEDLGPAPAEIGRWCIAESHRNVAEVPDLHFGMMKLVFLFAQKKAITDFLICVYPDLERFYRGLYFEDSGLRFRHPDWGAVGLFRLDIPQVTARLERRQTKLASFMLSGPDKYFSLGEH